MSGEDNNPRIRLVSADADDRRHSSDEGQATRDPTCEQDDSAAGDDVHGTDPVSQDSSNRASHPDQTKDTDDSDERLQNESADKHNLDTELSSSHDERSQDHRTEVQSSAKRKEEAAGSGNDETTTTREMGQGDDGEPENSTATPVLSYPGADVNGTQGDRNHGDSETAGKEESLTAEEDGEPLQDRQEDETQRLLPISQKNGNVAHHDDWVDAGLHDDGADVTEDVRLENLADSVVDLEGKAAAGTYFDSTPYVRHRGIKKYSSGLKTLLPVRTDAPKDVLPISHLGFFNLMSYGWATPIIRKLMKKGEDTLNSYKLSEYDCAETNCKRLELLWNEELAKKGPDDISIGRVIIKAFRTRLICTFIAITFFITFSLLTPIYLIRSLLEYLTVADSNLKKGIALVIGMGLCELLRALSMSLFWFLSYQSGLRMRSAAMTLLFKKILNLKNLKDKSAGQLVNLIGNDSQRIFEAISVGPLVFAGPVAMLGGCSYAIYYLGPWALVGCAVFAGFYPLNTFISRLTSYLRRKGIMITDKRVRMMNELLSCIKLIKMYAWEKPFARQIETIRLEERRVLEASAVVQSISTGTAIMVPSVASTLTFIAMTSAGNDLTAAQAFSFVALLNSMRFVLAVLPYGIKALSEVSVALNRYQEVMLMQEMEPRSSGFTPPKDLAIEVKDACLHWGAVLDDTSEGKDKKKTKKKSGSKANGKKENGAGKAQGEQEKMLTDEATNPTMPEVSSDQPTLTDITFSLPKGKLLGVCGSVGSGKSSLIQAILGRMENVSGSVAVGGSIAYVPQQAWVMNASARENILFGSEFVKERYDAVIEACALQSDFEGLVSGDQTEIGERGINLSGGQKQRISLARALYSESDIYLLDDPLSAVDIHVGRHIFTKYISGALAGKSVVFVTHQLQYLPQCDDIIFLKDGQISERGHHDDMMAQNGEYATLMQIYYKEHTMELEEEEDTDLFMSQGRPSLERALSGASSVGGSHGGDKQLNVLIERALSVTSKVSTTEVHSAGAGGDESQKPGGQLIVAEENNKGSIGWHVYSNYIKAGGGACVCLLVFLIFFVSVVAQNSSNVFLNEWLRQGSGNTSIQVGNTTVISLSVTDHPQFSTFILIYGLLILLMIVFLVIRGVAFMKLTLNASSIMHDDVFQKILTFPMAFFDSTPLGRIVNRFSSDMDEVDVRLPLTGEVFLSNVLHVIVSLVVIVYVSYWFLCALIPLLGFFLVVLHVFKQTVRQIKRADMTTRSPLLSHLTASVQGITTIHAYSRTGQFLKKYCDLVNTNAVPFIMFHFSNRWLAMRLELICCVLTVSTGLVVVLSDHGVSPAMAGLALSAALQMTGLFQFTVRLAVETEARFTSVERIQDYARTVASEAASIVPDHRPSKEWPKNGSIIFSKVKMRYRDSLPLTLKGVSFKVNPQEKIGIVGRTGSGKSTLGVVLFRLVELAGGSICIDDLDTSTIGLEDLRSKLSIIPQDPVLFIGTVRYNLDPFNSHTDDQLWAALEKCHIKDAIAGLDLKLEAPVVENGENFSVGERQLLCMARALLRHSKILMLDEATAAIDTETDALVQATLREAFWDCTMLIIAHRLNTVLSCDKILVMDEGKVAEFDRPSVLMSKSGSIFRNMLEASEGSGLD